MHKTNLAIPVIQFNHFVGQDDGNLVLNMSCFCKDLYISELNSVLYFSTLFRSHLLE